MMDLVMLNQDCRLQIAQSDILSSCHHPIIINYYLIYRHHHIRPEYQVSTHLAGAESLHVGVVVLHLELSVRSLQRIRLCGAQLGNTKTPGFSLFHRRSDFLLLHPLLLLLVPSLSVGVGTASQADVRLTHDGSVRLSWFPGYFWCPCSVARDRYTATD